VHVLPSERRGRSASGVGYNRLVRVGKDSE
jgi:hypothetical protein